MMAKAITDRTMEEKEIKIPKRIYEYPDEIAKELLENKVGKVEYICLRLAWRLTEREKPDPNKAVLFMVCENDDKEIDEVCVGCYEAPHAELDEYGDDGEGFYANEGDCYHCGAVLGWAYLKDLLPFHRKEDE